MERENLQVNGKPVTLDIIGRKGDRETYAFLRSRDQSVYGIGYDVHEKRITQNYQFFPDEHYAAFRNRWGLEKRDDFPMVRTSLSTANAMRGFCYITDTWNFQQLPVTAREREDIEHILEELRVSHIDFSVVQPTYAEEPLTYTLETIKMKCFNAVCNCSGPFHHSTYSPNLQRPKEYHDLTYYEEFIENNEMAIYTVTDYAKFDHHPFLVRRVRDFDNHPSDPRADYTYIFEGGEELYTHKELLRIRDPEPDGTWFIGDWGHFIDAHGHRLGENVIFPHEQALVTAKGTFKAPHEVKEYSFKHIDKILDKKGNFVASLGSKGFLHDFLL